MNNEPVAWAIKSDGDFTEIGWSDEVLHEVEEWYTAQGWQYEYIPLYTATQFHPAKTLTDEEIISSAEEAGFNWSEDKGIFVRHSNGSWIGLDSKMVDFARAILRKAQEK